MLDLVGVWRLVGASYVVLEGTSERTELLGSEPRAYAIFEPGGRMMVIGQANDRNSGHIDRRDGRVIPIDGCLQRKMVDRRREIRHCS